MLRSQMPHLTDAPLTPQIAGKGLSDCKIRIGWYTNHANSRSIVHSHPYFEIVMVMSGAALYSADGVLYPMAPGEFILFPSGSYHSARFGSDSENSERVVLQIDKDFLQQRAAALAARGVFVSLDHVLVYTEEAAGVFDIRGLLDRIANASGFDDDTRGIAYESELTELLLILSALSGKKSVARSSASNVLVKKVVSYLQLHFTDQTLTVEKLSAHFFVTREHLSRTFKAYTLESVHNYLLQLRMQRVRSLIAAGTPVLSAAEESGFSNYTSFVKSFRKLYNMSPSDYRKGTV